MVLSENLVTTDVLNPALLNSALTSPLGGIGARIAVDSAVGGAEQTPSDRFIETLIEFFVARHGTEVLVDAQNQFYQQAGKVFAEDLTYEQRIYYFLNHFLFERPLSAIQRQTPLLEYLDAHPESAWADGFTHSVFKILKSKPQQLIVKDLLLDRKLKIDLQEHQAFEGLNKDDVFQGFLLHRDGLNHLSRGLIFHPDRSRKILASLMKDQRKRQTLSKDQILFALARQQLKHLRLKHVDPKIVYQEKFLVNPTL